MDHPPSKLNFKDDEIIDVDSKSDTTATVPNASLLRSNGRAVSFSSLPLDATHASPVSLQRSDFIDSLRSLCIPLREEIELMLKYFPTRATMLKYFPSGQLMLNSAGAEMVEITHDALGVEPEKHAVYLQLLCSPVYPTQPRSCVCSHVKCAAFSHEECQSLRNKLNAVAQKQCSQGRNALLVMMIHLDSQIWNIHKKMALKPGDSIYDSLKAGQRSVSNSSVSMNQPQSAGAPVGHVAALMPKNGFFDSLNSLHQNFEPPRSPNPKRKEQILPSSFDSFEDILRSKSADEMKMEQVFAAQDEKLLCARMCGAVWGRHGQLIFFNNVLRRQPKNGKKLDAQHARNSIRSFRDYNAFLETRGAQHTHFEELQQSRKNVFANHLDEDEDRFGDEFVVGFSLCHRQSTSQAIASVSGAESSSKPFLNGAKLKYNHPYGNGYGRRLRSQHHTRFYLHSHHHKDTQHHIIPHLVLPSSPSHKTGNGATPKKRSRHGSHRKEHHLLNDARLRTHTTQSTMALRKGNARVFCPAILQYSFNLFSLPLMAKCKLAVSDRLSVPQLCIYNANLCTSLALLRVSRVLETFSTVLRTANETNVLRPSVYHCNYIAQFIRKTVKTLYLTTDVQAMAIVACLLRQSQFFAVVFYDCELKVDNAIDTNCGYLLQRCVSQYLRVIQYRIPDSDISDVEQLQNFCGMLEQQKKLLR